eukprot:g22323.t1
MLRLVGESITTEHSFKVRRERYKRDLRGNFFMQRVVRVWNGLPEEAVEAGTMTTFKRHFDGSWTKEYEEVCNHVSFFEPKLNT